MSIRALLYHDVVPVNAEEESGFVSPDANIYKVTVPEFDRHMARIHERTGQPSVHVFDALARAKGLLLTFDDGGLSGTRIADMLASYNSIGHFFITTDHIGSPRFLSRAGIADLARRGHVIGSHSCSHPLIMSGCSRKQLEHEWRNSVAALSDILGFAVKVASVPGGSYSRMVGETAAEAGIEVLFTSEPTSAIDRIGKCTLVGRYSVQRSTPADTAAALAAGDWLPGARQAAYWGLKKILKRAGGRAWLEFRKAVLSRTAR